MSFHTEASSGNADNSLTHDGRVLIDLDSDADYQRLWQEQSDACLNVAPVEAHAPCIVPHAATRDTIRSSWRTNAKVMATDAVCRACLDHGCALCSEVGQRFRAQGPSLDDPNFVHWICDVSNTGFLDTLSTTRALASFGLRPQNQMLASYIPKGGLDCRAFAGLVHDFKQTLPNHMQSERVVPHALRGLSFGQLRQLVDIFVDSGWLQLQCDDYNAQNVSTYAFSCNLYAVDKFIVMPLTSPGPSAARTVAQPFLPDVTFKCSYAEMLNPNGLFVHYFVSHAWLNPIAKTLKALRHASQQIEKPDDVVFWICLFALNQHAKADEVGDSPSCGPFNAAITFSLLGIVMVIGKELEPLRRIWCLYEIHRLTELEKNFEFLTEDGPLVEVVGNNTRRIMMSGSLSINKERLAETWSWSDFESFFVGLQDVGARKATASSDSDLHKIWHEIVHPGWRRSPLQQLLQQGTFESKLAFANFDSNIRNILITPFFYHYMKKGDKDMAVRLLSIGAKVRPKDVWCLQAMSCDLDVCYEDRPLILCRAMQGDISILRTLLEMECDPDSPDRSSDPDYQGRTGLIVAAMVGHQAVAHELVAHGSQLEATTAAGCTALQWAAFGGFGDIVQMLVVARARVDSVGCPKSGNYKYHGSTPLHFAAGCGHEEVVQLLLQHHAQVDFLASQGVTPLHRAAEKYHEAVLNLLVAKRADPQLRISSSKHPVLCAWACSCRKANSRNLPRYWDRHAGKTVKDLYWEMKFENDDRMIACDNPPANIIIL